MKILSIDVETTWTEPVNPRMARIREIGAVLYDWDFKRPLKLISEFIFEEDHPPSPKELVDLTGITDEMAKEYGVGLSDGLKMLGVVMEKADMVIAHNGNAFDKIVVEEEGKRAGINLPVKDWLDTKIDVPYPPNIKTRKLIHLCAEMGFVNPFAHRALFDALSVIEVIKHFKLDEIISLAKEKTYRLIAEVSYAEKDKAKKLGFYWDGENKEWFKEVKERYVEPEKEAATFNIRVRELA